MTTTIQFGFRLRTGGNLPDKVFGIFSLHEHSDDGAEDNGATLKTADHQESEAWAKKQNRQAAFCDKFFTFTAYVPSTEAEESTLYAQFLAIKGQRAAYALYS